MAEIFTKKLTRFGQKALCLILPKGYVDFYKLKGGDEVEMIVDEELLVKLPKEVLEKAIKQKRR